jgi:hypothetical protein
MVNDAAIPDIVGGRLFIRPIPGFKAALGFSALVDFNPARDFYDPFTLVGGPAAAGNPIFINPGVDLDLPFIESDVFGLVMFADGAVLLPYFRSAPTDPAYSSIKPGLATNAVYDPSASIPIKNWGAAAGFFGNLIIPDFTWRLEYRYFTGTFQPQFYDSGYERNRSQYVNTVLQYLMDPTNQAYNTYKMGIYGEGGFVLTRIFSLKLGYFWPWTINPSTGGITPDPNNPDHFIASFVIQKGVIPIVNVWGSVSYERTNLFMGSNLPTSLGDALLSANTVVSAQINYPVSPIMDVSLLYTTMAARDGNGNLIYSQGSLLPDMSTSLSIMMSLNM